MRGYPKYMRFIARCFEQKKIEYLRFIIKSYWKQINTNTQIPILTSFSQTDITLDTDLQQQIYLLCGK